MSDSDDFDNDDVLPTPIWNESEKTFFCTACTWEVVDGECCQCGLKHAWEETPDMIRDRIHNENYAIHPDRDLHPRGTTPVCVLTPKEYGDSIPMGYTPELYWALRQRGVSECMCWHHRIEYTYQGGIWVEFDPSSRLYKEMLHPSFHNGLKWRVYLGRKVQLAEGNPNGTDFIERLIEDAVFYPCQEPESRRMGSATQEENDWTSDQEDEHEWEDWVASAGEAGLAQDLALETGASLLPKPFMNDYHAESEYEESDTDEDQLVEGIEQVNLESSDEEVDELEDEEAAIQLFPDTIWEPSSGDEEDTTSDWTTEESEWEGSADSGC